MDKLEIIDIALGHRYFEISIQLRRLSKIILAPDVQRPTKTKNAEKYEETYVMLCGAELSQVLLARRGDTKRKRWSLIYLIEDLL